MKATKLNDAELKIRRVGPIVLFQKGPLSQWWGGFLEQDGNILLHGGSDTSPYFWEQIFLNHIKKPSYVFNCAEKYMMIMKAVIMGDMTAVDEMIETTMPGNLKAMGRKITNYDQKRWDSLKEQVVFRGNYLKFSTNIELKELLRSFSPFTTFAEGSSWDSIWGIGLDIDDSRADSIENWKGQNLLGRAISKVRWKMFMTDGV